MAIRTQYPECLIGCDDENCPYTHVTTYVVFGYDGQEYGPFVSLQEARNKNKIVDQDFGS